MKELSIREARTGLSRPETLFADDCEVVITRHGRPVARLLPPEGRPRVRDLRAFRAAQTPQQTPSEELVAEGREDRV